MNLSLGALSICALALFPAGCTSGAAQTSIPVTAASSARAIESGSANTGGGGGGGVVSIAPGVVPTGGAAPGGAANGGGGKAAGGGASGGGIPAVTAKPGAVAFSSGCGSIDQVTPVNGYFVAAAATWVTVGITACELVDWRLDFVNTATSQTEFTQTIESSSTTMTIDYDVAPFSTDYTIKLTVNSAATGAQLATETVNSTTFPAPKGKTNL